MIRNRFPVGMFLFGLGSQLQIVASLSMSELFTLCAAPLLYSREQYFMKRNGVMPLFWLSTLVVIGCSVSCLFNHTRFLFALRGMATTCLMPCSIIVGHWFLRRNPNCFKWWLLGGAISGIMCTFFFQKAVEVAMWADGATGDAAVAGIMSGPLFWISRLGSFILYPARAWYLQCPSLYCVVAPLFLVAFSMLTSSSGRSAALGALASATIVLIGGKRQHTMRRLGKYFWGLCLVGVIMVYGAKELYRIAAISGWLGDEAYVKYERQTKGKTGIMALLMGGRMESFCGLIACVDKPIVGFGPWPEDRGGYVADFLARFANPEDYDRFIEMQNFESLHGTGYERHSIPAHSIIVQFWLWYGIFGLIFWLYVIFVFIRYLRRDCWVVPQWYMWLAAAIPGWFWNIFFSPYGDRAGSMLFITACLIAGAVRRGRQPLPVEMLMEIDKENRR